MLLLIVIIVLMVINLFLYHKMFGVVYFDLGAGLVKEIGGAFFVALIEIALVQVIGKSLLGGILSIVGWIIKALIIVAVVTAAIYIVYRVVKIVRERMERKEDDIETDSSIKMKQTSDTAKNNEYEMERQQSKKADTKNIQKVVGYCPYCGEKIAKNAMFCNFCGKEKWVRKNN